MALAGGLAVTALALRHEFPRERRGLLGVKAFLLAPPVLVAIVAAHRVLGRPHWSDTVRILNLEVPASGTWPSSRRPRARLPT